MVLRGRRVLWHGWVMSSNWSNAWVVGGEECIPSGTVTVICYITFENHVLVSGSSHRSPVLLWWRWWWWWWWCWWWCGCVSRCQLNRMPLWSSLFVSLEPRFPSPLPPHLALAFVVLSVRCTWSVSWVIIRNLACRDLSDELFPVDEGPAFCCC